MMVVYDWLRGTVINGGWHRGSSSVKYGHMRSDWLPGR